MRGDRQCLPQSPLCSLLGRREGVAQITYLLLSAQGMPKMESLQVFLSYVLNHDYCGKHLLFKYFSCFLLQHQLWAVEISVIFKYISSKCIWDASRDLLRFK